MHMVLLMIVVECFFVAGLLSLAYMVRKGKRELRWGVGTMLGLVAAFGLRLLAEIFSYYHLAGAGTVKMAVSLFFLPLIFTVVYCILRDLQLRSEITAWFRRAYLLAIVFLVGSWLRAFLRLSGLQIMPNPIFSYVVLLGLIAFGTMFWMHQMNIRKK
jgi:hypothetical protein